MKVVLKKALCVSILLGLSSAALAQDWSGFYAGPQFSYNSVNTGWSFEQDQFYTVPGQSTSFSMNPSGFTMGAHLGWAHQLNQWVLGIESSYDAGSFSDKKSGTLSSLYPDDQFSTKISQLLTVTPKLGYSEGSWMYYIKGGYASAKLDISALSGEPVAGVGINDSQRQDGLTAGVGVEYQLNEKHSFGLEYDYTRLGSADFTTTTTGPEVLQEKVTIQPSNINTITMVYSYRFG